MVLIITPIVIHHRNYFICLDRWWKNKRIPILLSDRMASFFFSWELLANTRYSRARRFVSHANIVTFPWSHPLRCPDSGARAAGVPTAPVRHRGRSITPCRRSNRCDGQCSGEVSREYLCEKTINLKSSEDVGHYWRMSPFKRLKLLAPKYLCIPLTTVFSERLFSTAVNISDRKRNRLDPERVKMLIFSKQNLEKAPGDTDVCDILADH